MDVAIITEGILNNVTKVTELRNLHSCSTLDGTESIEDNTLTIFY